MSDITLHFRDSGDYNTFLAHISKESKGSEIDASRLEELIIGYEGLEINEKPKPGEYIVEFTLRSHYNDCLAEIVSLTQPWTKRAIRSVIKKHSGQEVKPPARVVKPPVEEGSNKPLERKEVKPVKRNKKTAPSPLETERKRITLDMNDIFISGRKVDNMDPLSSDQRDMAKEYFLKLLGGEYSYLGEHQIPDSAELRLDHALLAYLPFQNGDRGFLVESGDSKVAYMLMAGVVDIKFTDARRAYRVLFTLIGEKINKIPGFTEDMQDSILIEGSVISADTITYINDTLKTEVLAQAEGIYQ